ncbi:MAG: universal stress protein [Armatimonadota bacterium]|nr:universal stress protein [Armatimonadota bacterium]
MIIEARGDTITLRGEIERNIWPAIQAAAALLLENNPSGIIIDCSGVTRITPKGAETFADAIRYITSHDAKIIVAELSPELLEIGKAVPAVRAQLPVAATVEEARAALKLIEKVPQRGKARIAGVVPVVGNWRRAVFFADKLAIGENCEIHVVDLIKVPRTLPLDTPMPEREAEAQARLEEARGLVRETGLSSFAHVEHVRSEAGGLLEFVSQLGADFTVVSLDRMEGTPAIMELSEAMWLAESADFEVSLVRGSPPDAKQTIGRAVVPAVGAWQHALEHTCKLVAGMRAAVELIYLIAIPRTQPIDAPMPDAEAAASDASKEAHRIGRRYSVSVETRVERVRDPVYGFMQILSQRRFDLAVVGVTKIIAGDYHIAHTIATEVLQDLPCEAIFLRVRASESAG